MVASRFIGVRAVWGQIGRMARPREGSSLGTKWPSPTGCCAASLGLGGGRRQETNARAQRAQCSAGKQGKRAAGGAVRRGASSCWEILAGVSGSGLRPRGGKSR